MAKAVLWIVGMPLSDEAEISARAKECLETVDWVIGETRRQTMRYLVQVPGGREKKFFLLDESARPEEKAWLPAVQQTAKSGGAIALFSDTGMPLLFDPGHDVLEACRRLGFEVRSVPSATSWASAAALSGWGPPFLVAGFPPREERDREVFLSALRQGKSHCVLMERPYRFRALLGECREVFGKTREAFLAWELDSETEKLIWGSLDALEKAAARFEKTKGEFVLVLRGSHER